MAKVDFTRFSAVISQTKSPGLKVFFSALQCAAGITTGAATGGVTAIHAVTSCGSLLSSIFGLVTAGIFKNLENVQFPPELLAEIGYAMEYSAELNRVLKSVTKGGRECYGYQTPPLIDRAYESLSCAVQKTHEYAAKRTVNQEQVFFQDSSDLEKAVGVLRSYREMLLQGLQLAQIEMNAQCVTKLNGIANIAAAVCPIDPSIVPANANLDKCGDALKYGDRCQVECNCGFKDEVTSEKKNVVCTQSSVSPFYSLVYPNQNGVEDMKCVPMEGDTQPCCNLNPGEYLSETPSEAGTCEHTFAPQFEGKVIAPSSFTAKLDHGKTCTFSKPDGMGLDHVCGCGQKPSPELKCTNGKLEEEKKECPPCTVEISFDANVNPENIGVYSTMDIEPDKRYAGAEKLAYYDSDDKLELRPDGSATIRNAIKNRISELIGLGTSAVEVKVQDDKKPNVLVTLSVGETMRLETLKKQFSTAASTDAFLTAGKLVEADLDKSNEPGGFVEEQAEKCEEYLRQRNANFNLGTKMYNYCHCAVNVLGEPKFQVTSDPTA